MKFKLNKEEKFILSIVIIVVMAMGYILNANQKLQTEEAVETSYEAGYSACLEDTKNLLTVVETYEDEKGVHITLEYQDGERHEYLSPAALG